MIPVALCPADLKPVAPACIKGHVLQLVDALKLSFHQALSDNSDIFYRFENSGWLQALELVLLML